MPEFSVHSFIDAHTLIFFLVKSLFTTNGSIISNAVNMKKLVSLFLVCISSTQFSLSQTNPETPVTTGKTFITPFIGFPNLLTTVIQNAYELSNHQIEQLHVKSIGPIGIGASYLITDRLALGGEVSYASTSIEWKEKGTAAENDSTKFSIPYRFELKAPRFRILAKLNYHLAMFKHNDLYLGFGMGYNYTRVRLDTDAPYVKDFDFLSFCFLPLSARINVGYSYYFAKNVGVNAEIGLGGPLIAVGITGRF
jgi:hypothetical protein